MKSEKRKSTAKNVIVASEPHIPARLGIDGAGMALMSPAAMHHIRRMDVRKRPKAFNAALFAEFCERMTNGEYPVEIIDRSDYMPSYKTLRRYLAENAEAQAAYDSAGVAFADLLIGDAGQFAREAASTGDIDDMRTADSYVKTVNATVGKLFPRTHGDLLKLAGADGGAISVAVINYAEQKRAE